MEVALHRLEKFLAMKLNAAGLSDEKLAKIWAYGHQHRVLFWTNYVDKYHDLWELLEVEHVYWNRVVARDLRLHKVGLDDRRKFRERMDEIFKLIKDRLQKDHADVNDLVGAFEEIMPKKEKLVRTIYPIRHERSRYMDFVSVCSCDRVNVSNLKPFT